MNKKTNTKKTTAAKPSNLARSRTVTNEKAKAKDAGEQKVGFTWGRTMSYHPHTPFIVPGGALSEDGTAWLNSSDKFFVPVKAASVMFRAKFREAMKACGLVVAPTMSCWLGL